MEAAKERMIAQLELETQEYSVFITDEKRTSSGSGVLFYPGSGNRLYIFTCAHVLDGFGGAISDLFFVSSKSRAGNIPGRKAGSNARASEVFSN